MINRNLSVRLSAVVGRALTKTFIHMPFVGTVEIVSKLKNYTSYVYCNVVLYNLVFFFVFSAYGRVLCTNKRLYIRSYENWFS